MKIISFVALFIILVPTMLYSQANRTQPVLLIFSGESNSGGQALNSEAAETEIAPRPRVQILNNLTFCFEALDIGANNNLDHFNLSTTKYHGWELELANTLYSGALSNDTVYLVKTGQGGSSIIQWGDSSVYYSKFKQRLDSAIAKLTRQYNQKPQIALFYSQGINDALIPTNLDAWKGATIAHIRKIRKSYGNISVYIPYFMTGFEAYNTAFDQIAAQLEGVKMTSSFGAELQDAYHWSYKGMKLVADNLIHAWAKSIHDTQQPGKSGAY